MIISLLKQSLFILSDIIMVSNILHLVASYEVPDHISSRRIVGYIMSFTSLHYDSKA